MITGGDLKGFGSRLGFQRRWFSRSLFKGGVL